MKKLLLIFAMMLAFVMNSCDCEMYATVDDMPYIYNGVTYSWYNWYYTRTLVPYVSGYVYHIPYERRYSRPPMPPMDRWRANPAPSQGRRPGGTSFGGGQQGRQPSGGGQQPRRR